MKFEESPENFYEVPKELMGNCYVYFLLDGDDVVYVGQTTNGMYRPFSHKDKVFNRVVAMPCERQNLDFEECKYIFKYNPIYNKKSGNFCEFSLKKLEREILRGFDLKLSMSQIISYCKFYGINIYSFNGVDAISPEDFDSVMVLLDLDISNHKVPKRYFTSTCFLDFCESRRNKLQGGNR